MSAKQRIFISSVQKELAQERQLRITNTEYQAAFDVAKRTAHRDLADLVGKGLVNMVGSTGKGTYYVLGQGATKGPIGPESASSTPQSKRATKGSKGP